MSSSFRVSCLGCLFMATSYFVPVLGLLCAKHCVFTTCSEIMVSLGPDLCFRGKWKVAEIQKCIYKVGCDFTPLGLMGTYLRAAHLKQIQSPFWSLAVAPTLALILLEMVFWAGICNTAQLSDSKGKSPLLAFISEGSAAGLFRNEK